MVPHYLILPALPQSSAPLTIPAVLQFMSLKSTLNCRFNILSANLQKAFRQLHTARSLMSSSRLTFVLLSAILLLADLAVSQSPIASPLPSPTPPKKKTPVMVPAASPTPSNKKTPVFDPTAAPAPNVPDYMAPGPSTTETDCMTLLFGAADCLTYVEEGSNLTAPEKACCPELATLVNTNPICLCQLLTKKGNSLGIAIDMTRALALPGACKVEVPDPSLCALVNGSPTDAPSSSPTDGLSPTGAVLPPTSVNNDNGGAVAIGSSPSSFLVALVAFAAFTWNMF